MFNWFENKHNNLVPSDIFKGIMTSNFTKIKLGQSITIPEDVCCFLSYHDKLYGELGTGTHTLEKKLLEKIYFHQQKSDKPLKKLDLDLLFINLNAQELKFSFTDKIPVKNKLTKFILQAKLLIKPAKPRVICEFLCAEFYSIDSINSKECYNEYCQEFLKKQLLKIELNSTTLPLEIKSTINLKLKDFMLNLGMDLLSFELKLFSKHQMTTVQNQNFDFQDNFITQKTTIKTVDQINQLNYNQNNLTAQNICPKCNNKIIKGAIYCHRCGQILK